MKNSNFYSYVAQLKTQANSKNPAVSKDAVQILSLFDKITKEKSGKEATKMSLSELKEIPFDLNQKSPDHIKYWGAPHSNFLGIFGKKNRKKREKLFGGVGKALEKVGRGIGDVVKKVARLVVSPATLPLLPFKKGMKRQLDKRNVPYKNDILDIAKQFYKHVVQKDNYEGYESYYQHVEETGNFVEDIAKIIKAIISFFNKNKDKIAKGIATVEELEMEKDVDDGHAEMKDPDVMGKALRENSIHTVQKSNMDTKSIVIYAIVTLVVLKVLKVI